MMDPRQLFHDDRLDRTCAYCGGPPSTRDHVPSRVLLDLPYPSDLPVVKACRPCNESFSLDEEYVACFLDCVISGSVPPLEGGRAKVRRLLERKARLAALIEGSRLERSDGQIEWRPKQGRIRNVLLKLARGHARYEAAEDFLRKPDHVGFSPLPTLSQGEREAFEAPPPLKCFPEIGSRAFGRAVVTWPTVHEIGDWQIVQPGRYRYLVSIGESLIVRVVLSEYLGGEVAWRD